MFWRSKKLSVCAEAKPDLCIFKISIVHISNLFLFSKTSGAAFVHAVSFCSNQNLMHGYIFWQENYKYSPSKRKFFPVLGLLLFQLIFSSTFFYLRVISLSLECGGGWMASIYSPDLTALFASSALVLGVTVVGVLQLSHRKPGSAKE